MKKQILLLCMMVAAVNAPLFGMARYQGLYQPAAMLHMAAKRTASNVWQNVPRVVGANMPASSYGFASQSGAQLSEQELKYVLKQLEVNPQSVFGSQLTETDKKAKFIELTKKYHPDKFAKDSVEQGIAAKIMSEINAFKSKPFNAQAGVNAQEERWRSDLKRWVEADRKRRIEDCEREIKELDIMIDLYEKEIKKYDEEREDLFYIAFESDKNYRKKEKEYYAAKALEQKNSSLWMKFCNSALWLKFWHGKIKVQDKYPFLKDEEVWRAYKRIYKIATSHRQRRRDCEISKEERIRELAALKKLF